MNLHPVKIFFRDSLNLEVKRFKPFIDYPLNQYNLKLLLYFERMLEKSSNVRGIIVECGIGELRSLQMLTLLQNERRDLPKRDIWAFDSFEGFPEPTVEDVSPRNPKKGEWKIMTKQKAEEVIAQLKTDISVTFHKGYFEESLPGRNIPDIALLHLDVDLYQSYKVCLEHLYSKVVVGGVICFDEYLNEEEHTKFPGAQKAIDEFLGDKSNLIQQDPLSKKYFFVKPK